MFRKASSLILWLLFNVGITLFICGLLVIRKLIGGKDEHE
jgi:hypothetical protein